MREIVKLCSSGERQNIVLDEKEKLKLLLVDGERNAAFEIEKSLLKDRSVSDFFFDVVTETVSAPLSDAVSDFESFVENFSDFRGEFFSRRVGRHWLVVVGTGKGRLLFKDVVLHFGRTYTFSREVRVKAKKDAVEGCFRLTERLLDCPGSKIDASLNHFSILFQMLAPPERAESLLAVSSVGNEEFVLSGAVFLLSNSLEWSFRLAKPPSVSVRGFSVRSPLLSRESHHLLKVLETLLERLFSQKEKIEKVDRDQISKEIREELSFLIVSESRRLWKKNQIL